MSRQLDARKKDYYSHEQQDDFCGRRKTWNLRGPISRPMMNYNTPSLSLMFGNSHRTKVSRVAKRSRKKVTNHGGRTTAAATYKEDHSQPYIETMMKTSRPLARINTRFSFLESIHGCVVKPESSSDRGATADMHGQQYPASCVKFTRWSLYKSFNPSNTSIPFCQPSYVFKVLDKETNKVLVLKQRNCFSESRADGLYKGNAGYYHNELMAACREGYILRKLRGTKFIIQLQETILETIWCKLHVLRLYHVFDYCTGLDLMAYMRVSQRSFEVSQIKAIGSQILMGLEELKAENIVHRNICAENILMSANGLVKICDFGNSTVIVLAAKEESAFIPNSGNETPPPELNEGVVDFGTDIWGFGVVLLEMYLGFNSIRRYSGSIKLIEEMAITHPETSKQQKKRYLCLGTFNGRDLRNNKYTRCDTSEQLENLVTDCISHNRHNRPSVSELKNYSIFNDCVSELETLSKADFECRDHGNLRWKAKMETEEVMRYNCTESQFFDKAIQESCSCARTLNVVSSLVAYSKFERKNYQKLSKHLERCFLCRTSGLTERT